MFDFLSFVKILFLLMLKKPISGKNCYFTWFWPWLNPIESCRSWILSVNILHQTSCRFLNKRHARWFLGVVLPGRYITNIVSNIPPWFDKALLEVCTCIRTMSWGAWWNKPKSATGMEKQKMKFGQCIKSPECYTCESYNLQGHIWSLTCLLSYRWKDSWTYNLFSRFRICQKSGTSGSCYLCVFIYIGCFYGVVWMPLIYHVVIVFCLPILLRVTMLLNVSRTIGMVSVSNFSSYTNVCV